MWAISCGVVYNIPHLTSSRAWPSVRASKGILYTTCGADIFDQYILSPACMQDTLLARTLGQAHARR